MSCVESVINCALKPEDPIELSVQHVLNRFARNRLKGMSKMSEGNPCIVRIEDVLNGFTCEEVLRTISVNGIPTEKAFKYSGLPMVFNANDWKTIPIPDIKEKYYIEGCKLITNDEFKIREALFKHPVIANVDATTWQYFKEDKVYWGPPVPFHLTNHTVLLVGCGIHNKTRYWIVRNSWGTNFVDGGHIKIVRGQNCFGIESEIWVPIIDLDTLCF